MAIRTPFPRRFPLAVLLALAACRGAPVAAPDPAPVAPPAAAAPEAPVPETVATFTAADGRRASFRLEIAATPATRERGLMFRREMAPDRGMVFVFGQDEVQTFWMKNTLLPLDMVFVEAGGAVAGVVHDARPMTLDVRKVDSPSRYVVELNAGVAKAKGIGAGATVTFEPALPSPSPGG
jgi:uncharacterized protein